MVKNADILFDSRKVPINTRFDDPYYSFQNGAAESQHVFLDGCNLRENLKAGFHIAELGFGTGLNFLLVWQFWRQLGVTGQIRFTSFEGFPMRKADQKRALANFPELRERAEAFLDGFDGQGFSCAEIALEVVLGDARETLPKWEGSADAWFLDGFSPAKNPELWGADLLREVYLHAEDGAHLATYSAAGFVRRNLSQAGFTVEKTKGFGQKRQMTTARKPSLQE